MLGRLLGSDDAKEHEAQGYDVGDRFRRHWKAEAGPSTIKRILTEARDAGIALRMDTVAPVEGRREFDLEVFTLIESEGMPNRHQFVALLEDVGDDEKLTLVPFANVAGFVVRSAKAPETGAKT